MSEDTRDEPFLAISFVCPHCETKAQFNLIFPDLSKVEKSLESEKATWKENVYSYNYSIWKCQVCKRLVFRAFQAYRNESKLIGQYPSSIRIGSDLADSVPIEILDDFESALKCYEFEEYRPTSAMCRRSLQASLLEQGADPTKDLFVQIDELNRKKPDRFTNDMKDWAHNIRIFGNWGAHPDKDGLKDVNQETAKEAIEFLRSYFHYVYAMPKKVTEARLRQKSNKK